MKKLICFASLFFACYARTYFNALFVSFLTNIDYLNDNSPLKIEVVKCCNSFENMTEAVRKPQTLFEKLSLSFELFEAINSIPSCQTIFHGLVEYWNTKTSQVDIKQSFIKHHPIFIKEMALLINGIPLDGITDDMEGVISGSSLAFLFQLLFNESSSEDLSAGNLKNKTEFNITKFHEKFIEGFFQRFGIWNKTTSGSIGECTYEIHNLLRNLIGNSDANYDNLINILQVYEKCEHAERLLLEEFEKTGFSFQKTFTKLPFMSLLINYGSYYKRVEVIQNSIENGDYLYAGKSFSYLLKEIIRIAYGTVNGSFFV